MEGLDFIALPKGYLQNLTSAQKMAIVLRHVVTGTTLLAADVTEGRIKTAGGESIFLFKNKYGEVKIQYSTSYDIRVVTADVKASNGVIHVTSSVIWERA